MVPTTDVNLLFSCFCLASPKSAWSGGEESVYCHKTRREVWYKRRHMVWKAVKPTHWWWLCPSPPAWCCWVLGRGGRSSSPRAGTSVPDTSERGEILFKGLWMDLCTFIQPKCLFFVTFTFVTFPKQKNKYTRHLLTNQNPQMVDKQTIIG